MVHAAKLVPVRMQTADISQVEHLHVGCLPLQFMAQLQVHKACCWHGQWFTGPAGLWLSTVSLPTCFFALWEPLLPSRHLFHLATLPNFNSPVLYSLAISPLHTSLRYPLIPGVMADTFVLRRLTEWRKCMYRISGNSFLKCRTT